MAKIEPNRWSIAMKAMWAKRKAALPPEDQVPKKYPKMIAAHRLVKHALDSGDLQRQDVCEKCGKVKSHWVHIHAHHDDYDQPLIVRWLCISCHMLWHSKHGKGKNIGNPK